MPCESETVLHASWQEAALFRPLRRDTAVRRIADELRGHIQLGDLDDGGRLPPLTKLAQLFGVSVPTVRAAVQALAYLDIVDVNPGRGTFVAAGQHSYRASLAGLRRARPEELREMRRLLEVNAAKLMAKEMARPGRHPSFKELHFWQGDLEMRRQDGPSAYLRTDVAYHRAVMIGARSTYAAALHAEVCTRLRPSLLGEAVRQADDAELAELHFALMLSIGQAQAERAAIQAARIAALEA